MVQLSMLAARLHEAEAVASLFHSNVGHVVLGGVSDSAFSSRFEGSRDFVWRCTSSCLGCIDADSSSQKGLLESAQRITRYIMFFATTRMRPLQKPMKNAEALGEWKRFEY